MITTERIGDTMCFDVDGQRLTLGARNGRVSLHVCDCHTDDLRPANMDTEDTVSLLRAMLREIAGPSIDDVREVWGVPHADIEVQDEDVFAGYTEAVVCVWVGSHYRCFEAATLREALQAAYDAGVERNGGDET